MVVGVSLVIAMSGSLINKDSGLYSMGVIEEGLGFFMLIIEARLDDFGELSFSSLITLIR